MDKVQFEALVNGSTKTDWSYNEDSATLTYRSDPKLSIKSSNNKQQTFQAPWVDLLDNKKAFSENVEITYDGKQIDHFPVAYVDGKVDIPIPDANMQISNYEYKVTSLIDQLGYLVSTMNKCGITRRN